MKLRSCFLKFGLGALMVFGTACSSNKTAETSPVASSDAGKGTAPPANEVKKDDSALVRFVNATPSSKALAFGDSTPFTSVGSFDVTEYKVLPAQRHEFKLLENGEAAKSMATDSEGLSSGKHYTIVAVTEKDGTFHLDNISDDLTPPDPGKVKVRVINLAPAVRDLDLYSSEKKSALISGAGLDHPTDYKQIDPSEGTLDIRNSMSKRHAEVIKDVHMEAGKLYTILVFGDRNGKLKVKTIEDVFTAAPNGTKS